MLADALPDPDLRRYAQKLFGATLIGEQVDDFFVLVYGTAATGKTTLTEPFRRLLGGYAATVEPESLMTSRNGGGGAARGDIARLAGVRFALVSEVEDGARLASGLVKRLCGGDRITARRLYREEAEFTPQFTLWFVANHRPKVDAGDDGLWRRVKVLPFDQVIPAEKRDPKIKQAMTSPENLAALLAWSVQGCLAYQHEGLTPPAAVMHANADYRENMDPIQDFLDSCCQIGEGLRVSADELREAYLTYCRAESVKFPLTPKAFGDRLRGRGFETARFYCSDGRQRRGWASVGLADSEPDKSDKTDKTDSCVTFSHESDLGKVTQSAVSSVSSVLSQSNETWEEI